MVIISNFVYELKRKTAPYISFVNMIISYPQEKSTKKWKKIQKIKKYNIWL